MKKIKIASIILITIFTILIPIKVNALGSSDKLRDKIDQQIQQEQQSGNSGTFTAGSSQQGGKPNMTVWNNIDSTQMHSNPNANEGELKPDSSTSPSTNSSHNVDEIMKEAETFIQRGKKGSSTLNGDNLKIGSNTIYNILLSIGIVVAVAVGAYLGLKFVTSSADDKAKVKESLIPYIAGCVVIFGAFIIWRLAIYLLGGL